MVDLIEKSGLIHSSVVKAGGRRSGVGENSA